MWNDIIRYHLERYYPSACKEHIAVDPNGEVRRDIHGDDFPTGDCADGLGRQSRKVFFPHHRLQHSLLAEGPQEKVFQQGGGFGGNMDPYAIDGTSGFWECDLSRDAAEYVTLDWSSAAEYQGRIVPGTLRMERFEAASRTLQFVAYMSNGTQLNFYTSVVGADRGVIKTSVGSDGNAGLVVTTMVRLK